MPIFSIIIGNVAEFCISMTRIGSIDRIGQTVLVAISNAQVSVAELAVPSVFTTVGSTTGVLNQDGINTVIDVECHLTSTIFADMPRQTCAAFECAFTGHHSCVCSDSSKRACRSRSYHCKGSDTSCQSLAQFCFAHWIYPPIKISEFVSVRLFASASRKPHSCRLDSL